MAEFPQVFGAYLLLKAIATGASSELFLARPTDTRRDIPSLVVVKRLHPDLAEREEERLRFRQEAEIAVAVDSPHVAKVFDAGRVGGSYFIAIEYIPGWTLARIVTDLRAAGAVASLPSIRDIISDALLGLEALHEARGVETGRPLAIVHRDVSPKNLMVGEDSITRVIDFGTGKSLQQGWRTRAGQIIGSHGYLAPEQARGLPVDRRTDLYALGIVLWELLTARSYFDPAPSAKMLESEMNPIFRPPSAFRPGLSPAVDALLAQAVASDSGARFASARAFREALLETLGERESERASSTVVGAMLWGELGASQTDVTRLLAEAAVGEPRRAEETMIIARRSARHQGAIPQAIMASSSTFPGPLVLAAPERGRASPARAFGPIVAAMVVTVGVSAALIARKRGVSAFTAPPLPASAGRMERAPEPRARPLAPPEGEVLSDGREGDQQPIEELERARLGEGEGERARLGEGEGEGERAPLGEGERAPLGEGERAHLGEGERAHLGEGERAHLGEGDRDRLEAREGHRPARRNRGRSKRSRERRRAESAALAQPEPEPEPERADVNALLARARRLERTLEPGSDKAQKISRIVSDLSMEMSRKEIDGARARALAGRLRRLEEP